MGKRLLAGLALVCLLTGCFGYRAQNLFREDIKTVYVEGFDNETFRRGLEVPLTRAVQDELRLRTPLLFASREEADSVLTGELVAADEESQVKSKRGRILLQRVLVRVRFRWIDRLTGAPIVPEQTVTESVRLPTDVAETGIGIDGRPVPADLIPQEAPFDPAFREVAQLIVERMQHNW
ncbi:MAG: LptE family protein [Candidatus Brocadiia bacterium]